MKLPAGIAPGAGNAAAAVALVASLAAGEGLAAAAGDGTAAAGDAAGEEAAAAGDATAAAGEAAGFAASAGFDSAGLAGAAVGDGAAGAQPANDSASAVARITIREVLSIACLQYFHDVSQTRPL